MAGPTRTHLSDFRGAARMAFDATAGVAGIPVIYVYIFSAWASLIGLAALVIERSR